MSFTAAYSKLHHIDEDGEVTSRQPKILDMDAFKQAAKDVDMDADTFRDIAVTKERTDRTTYPEQTFQHLVGFKSWTPRHCIGVTRYNDPSDFDSVRGLFQKVEEALDKAKRDYSTGGLGFCCNIERFGIPYGTDPRQVLEFYARVSEATEPFVVWHSNREHDFTDLHDMDLNSIDEEVVYRIECRDGEGELYKVTFEHVEEKKIVETDDVGDAE